MMTENEDPASKTVDARLQTDTHTHRHTDTHTHTHTQTDTTDFMIVAHLMGNYNNVLELI